MITVGQLLEMSCELDVYDDYDERLGLAFIGPVELTDKGFKKFKRALALKCEPDFEQGYAVVHIENGAEHVMENDAEAALSLFASLAGYCADDDWHDWFKDVEEDFNEASN